MKKLVMIVSILVVFLVGLFGYRITHTRYGENQIQLALAFSAVSYCSCLFVMELDERQCQSYASVDQLSPQLMFDSKEKTTKAAFLKYWYREAQFLGPKAGCQNL